MATCSDTIWPSIPEDVAAFAVPLLSGLFVGFGWQAFRQRFSVGFCALIGRRG
jgi:hypothetical protein